MSSEVESGPFVEIALGKRSFYVPLAKIQKFPESYFCVALKPHWNNNEYLKSEDNVEEYKLLVDRDARLFRYIAMYLELGYIPRDKKGDCWIDPTLFAALREEADYFCLSSMVADLDTLLTPAVFARYIGFKMDSECSRDDGIILGSSVDNRFSTSQPLGYLQNMIQFSFFGFNSACSLDSRKFSYYLAVDSNVIMCDDQLASYYQTLLSVYKSSGGRANLGVSDHVYQAIIIACNKTLNIPQSRHKVKLQQLIVRTSSSEFTINNTEDISDDAIVAYALVNRDHPGQGYSFKGGEFEFYFVVRLCNSMYRSICAMKSVKYKLNPVLEGIQCILKFAIVKEDCINIGTDLKICPCPIGPQRSVQESRQLSLDYLLHCIQQHGAIGVYSSCSYLTESKFSPETLLEGSYDKALYEFATSRGISLSMVYVRCCNKSHKVQYVPQPHDMLLDCHKQNKNIFFMTSSHDCSVYGTARRVVNSHQTNNKEVEFITSAFIVG